jgi:hypothetical protein
MKHFLIITGLFLAGWNASGQLLPELNYPQIRYAVDRWEAKWITCADMPEADYAVVMFRRSFSLPEKPEQFIIHLSADNRYKLYVNGRIAAIGPQGSDWRHWRYETLDIAPCLQAGENVIAAEVVNYLTTTPERIVDQRSECHPWSASPSMAFVSVVAGIFPAEPGYKSVNIQPALGSLKYVKASYPHYLGDIKVDVKRKGTDGIEGTVELPKGLNGVFKWGNRVIGLTEGTQRISL